MCLISGCALLSLGWAAGQQIRFAAHEARETAARKVAAPYIWRNVNITAGGFVDGLIFSPVQRGLIYARTDIGGAYRWEPEQKHWIPLNDWAGGKDANLLGCESIGVDPVDADRVYMAAGTYTQSWAGNGAILRSRDQGRTWLRTDMPFKMGGNEEGRSIGERLAVDPNNDSILYFGSRHDGLWKSEDDGATWNRVNRFPVSGRTNGVGIGFILFDPSGTRRGQASQTIYVGVAVPGFGLCRSVDGGATWAVVTGQPAGLLPHQGALDGKGNLYLTYSDAPGPNGMTNGAVWKLNVTTGAWTDITPVKPGNPSGFGYAALSLDRLHPDTIMVATMDRWNPGDDIFRSKDGGAHWTGMRHDAVLIASLTPWIKWGRPAPSFGWWLGALAIDPFDPNHVIYGTGATIWGTNDATLVDAGQPTHWFIHAAGLEETAVICMVSPPEGPHLISGLGDIGGFRHDKLDKTPSGMWTHPQIDNTDSIDFAENQPSIVVRVGRGKPGQNGAYSSDGAATWAPFRSEPGGSRGAGSIAVSADGKTLVWAPAGSVVSYSRDQGATWTASTGASGNRQTVLSDRVRPNTFYLRNGDHLSISDDGGMSFHPVGTLPEGVRQVRATPGVEGDLWVTAGEHGLYHSTDGGARFSKVEGVQDAGSIGFGKPAPGHDYPSLYLTCQTPEGESGVFQSKDAGKSWLRLNDSAHQYGWPGQVVSGDPRVYGRVYLGTNGRGILYGEPAPTSP